MRRSRYFANQRIAILLLAGAAAVRAQSPFMPAYQGMQPELVQGIQDGLATGKPKIRHVYLAAPAVLAIVLHAQAIPRLPIQRYTKDPADRIVLRGPANIALSGRMDYRHRSIQRNGKPYGEFVGKGEKFYAPTPILEGEPLDFAWADDTSSYVLTSESDPAYRTDQKPAAVYRKNIPEMQEWVQNSGLKSTARYEIFLRLPKPLVPGNRYRIAFHGGSLGDGITFSFDPARLRTEAIHVNLLGYHPRQPEKLALLSMWLGSGGDADLSALPSFQLVDDATGAVRFRGDVRLRQAAVPGLQMPAENQRPKSDNQPVSTYALDFSGFSRPGRYRIAISGLGSSFPFRIDDAVWTDAARISAHGYLNQRSGIKLGPPYTKFERPRDMHPADGFEVLLTDPAAFFDRQKFPQQENVRNPFDRIQASILERTGHPGAWGGWHDAADFDRSILPQNHMRAVHAMLDLLESNPSYFEHLNLNLPESGNGLPDLLNEALWCMDLFQRIQQADGGVPSSVESIEHPGEPIYLLTQLTALIPPTPEASRLYSAAAAHLSIVLMKYDPRRAAAYRSSAERAMAWAESHAAVPDIFGFNPKQLLESANLAAVWMYSMTGEARWHNEFQRTFRELNPDGVSVRLDRTRYAEGPWGVAAYALLANRKVEAEIQARCRQAFVQAADRKTADLARWLFGLDPNPADYDKRLGDPWDLILAHRITNDPKYLRALERSAQYALGMNSGNASFTTGIGARQLTVFNLDAYYLGIPLPEGITAYGPYYRYLWGGGSIEKALTGIYPEWKAWPWAECMFNVRSAALNEYTVGGNMANQLLLRGYLAQQYPGISP